VADAGYESRWVDKDKQWRRAVQLLIMRAQRPLRLTGGPFYVISYETMLAVSNSDAASTTQSHLICLNFLNLHIDESRKNGANRKMLILKQVSSAIRKYITLLRNVCISTILY